MKRLGLDIGSTTMKYVLLGEDGVILTADYIRHGARIHEVCLEILEKLNTACPGQDIALTVSGSGGMGFAERLGLPFVQEVYAERLAVEKFYPETDAVIELGGEDAKILFLTGGFEMRMNGTCAGGTGAFIDQMAALMEATPAALNDLAARHKTVLPIASRCGVFAKSDVQPLLNQGASREDVAAGVFRAVVDQTIAGLAQGRRITGNVLYLCGPLTFLPELRKSFDEVLGIQGRCPERSLYYVALGAALAGVGRPAALPDLLVRVRTGAGQGDYRRTRPLFASQEEYDAFAARREGRPIIVLCGRPYHVDPEVNHGIDQRICDLGAAVVTEDCLSGLVEPFSTKVRNQWTYHSRMYAAAEYIAWAPAAEDLHLVQLVFFGCGVDAITTDEVRSILEDAGRDYTQLKIDEISNMGAATIRLRSLLAMLEEKRRMGT